MWARVVELMLGVWLAVSPFVFQHGPDAPALWANDLGCATAVIALSLLSFWRRLAYAHLVTIGVALWLVGFGYAASSTLAAPAFQNEILVGLVLLMLAIVPNEASQPPPPWRGGRRPAIRLYPSDERGVSS
jgi:hypothetical protein